VVVPALSSLSAIKIRLVKPLELKALEDMEDSGTLSPITTWLSKTEDACLRLVGPSFSSPSSSPAATGMWL
jgi:hypothetical protein